MELMVREIPSLRSGTVVINGHKVVISDAASRALDEANSHAWVWLEKRNPYEVEPTFEIVRVGSTYL